VIFVYSPQYGVDIGPHVFPTEKYNLIYERLKAEGIITSKNVLTPKAPSRSDLLKIISKEYLDDLEHARLTLRTASSEMPVQHNIIDFQMLCCGGSYLAAQSALKDGFGYHIGGGFHHAFPDHAEGFCYVNDVVFAAEMMLGHVQKVAVVDCDLHQGNGTAKFFQHEKRIFTFSIHQEYLYPRKENSDLDIGLENGVGDEEYLQKLDFALRKIYDEFGPDFIIYVAGADPFVFDQLGSLQVTVEGFIKRDEMVLGRAFEKKIPVAVVLAGGYAENVTDTVEIHCNTARVMAEFSRKERR
jgi:acetoin utilization deacetylase AcuC-like enzyme